MAPGKEDDPSASSEQALIVRAQCDPQAFGELYERYVDQIYAYLYYRTSSTWEAQDLTERVFLRAMEHLPKYSFRGAPFSAWLYRIAHNLVANWHRDARRRKIVSLEDALERSSSHDPEEDAVRAEEYATVREAVRRLSQERQNLLVLKMVNELSNREIAQILDKTEGAVKALFHRTMVALEEEILAITGEGAMGANRSNNGAHPERKERHVTSRVRDAIKARLLESWGAASDRPQFVSANLLRSLGGAAAVGVVGAALLLWRLRAGQQRRSGAAAGISGLLAG
jgi:RNA polymerase sigma-70 factor (ECF subfamily)